MQKLKVNCIHPQGFIPIRLVVSEEKRDQPLKKRDLRLQECKTNSNYKDANGRPDEEVASEAWENHRRLNNSFIVDYFQGQFKNTLKCLSCRYTSIKFDAFMFLSLPIPEKGKSNLADCLKQFQKREKLFGNERWFCPKCKAPKDSERTLELWRVPPMLIIHLKVRSSFIS